MIRKAGLAALGLILNTCPFTPPEPPAGYAAVTGRVLSADGTAYSGQVGISCSEPDRPSPSFGTLNLRRTDSDGDYSAILEASTYSWNPRQGAFEFLCTVRAIPMEPRGAEPVAVRYVTIPFAEKRADRPNTRVDLRVGVFETHPERHGSSATN
jgi:hypothetical protein